MVLHLSVLGAIEQNVFDRELYVICIPRKLFLSKKRGHSSVVDHVLSMHKTFGLRIFSTVKMISKERSD